VHVDFDEFELDSGTRELRRAGGAVPLQPKAFALLELLIAARPRAVAKREIQRRVWPDTHVGDANLNTLVGELRRALGDDARAPRFVRTVFGFGYAFAAEARDREVGPPAQRVARPRVVWEKRVFPLCEGDNVLGRAEDADLPIDVGGVSRRHARIRVAGDRATLEDLGSKNGTFIGNQRIREPTPLPDGIEFRLGRLRLDYFSSPDSDRTLTES